ncbi:alpha/beta hydrolase family protein [Tenacibaculum retecalamus]|uniref:alpha/beta hydrolase family protein n=1 Tax=Tenacibaculum retecalamus TaxID=3018315 RepID=UPI0023D905B2|nr:alpha/beta hydrolase [Tenacibaculum retecalamus]WBX70616.1 alpha/beta hydrolase [Tenacibaculum retecalamus]
MIRILTIIIFYTFSSVVSFAQIKSEEILIKNNEIELPGTLTFTSEKTPLLIWIHGSGNVDRDGNQRPYVKANYIKQFRDSVNQQGIAFFSYDKRTANQKNMPILKKGVLFDSFISDTQKIISHFKNNKRFSEISLIGHSQGSLIAMLASKNSNKYISLAGSSNSIDQKIVEQMRAKNPLIVNTLQEHFKELKETGGIKNVDPTLVTIFNPQNTPFFKSWMKYNPSEEIKKLEIPVLIINGTKDLQVSIEDAKTLHKSSLKSELVLIENMNHVLKHIDKDENNMKSYFSADFPLSDKLIKTVVTFVKK